ncbi:hypothetical protein GCM10009789_39060 [Kribbella sancticallisti]|uniref:PknH-like extracellular domain-containing protein n=2 Tax=Kribbella sancticallisti TaxID=460087 RepID=A0ABN2DRP3_9ACTN
MASGFQQTHTILPPAPRNRSLLTGITIAGFIVSAALLGFHVDTDASPATGAQGGYHIVIADTAGGLPQVKHAPAVAAQAEKQRQAGSPVQWATYAHPKYLASKEGTSVPRAVFRGADSVTDPETFARTFFDGLREKAPLLSGVTSFDAGPHGGLLRCGTVAVQQTTEAHCLWADTSTFGHLAITELTEREAAQLLVKMRSDLEKPR